MYQERQEGLKNIYISKVMGEPKIRDIVILTKLLIRKPPFHY